MDDVLRDITRRLDALERSTPNVRLGVVTDDSPPTVTLGGSDVEIPGVASLVPLTVGDAILAVTYGNGLVVLGPLLDTAWHEVGAGGEPAFANSWANKGGAYETVAFRHIPGNLVALKGSCGAGNLNTTIFTLPAAYRPAKDRRKGIGGYDAGVYYELQLYITAAGDVSVQGTGPSGSVDEAHLEAVFAL